MTFHINNIPDYHCHACDKVYIPYTKDFPCPYCAVPSKKFFDFIPEIIQSMIFHKMEYGTFSPHARYTGSMAEHIQGSVFGFLDDLEEKKETDTNLDIEKYLEKIIDEELFQWDDKPLAKYYKNIILEVYKQYKEETKGITYGKGETIIDIETPSFIRKKLEEQKLEKIKDIGSKKISILSSELQEDMSSENKYFTIHIDDKVKNDITEYALLHIGFSKHFLDTEMNNIDFDKIIDEEIDRLVNEVGDNLFKNEEYFVFYDSKGRGANKRFHPFIS